MSWNPGLEPHCPEAGELDAIEMQIIPRARDLGGFEVRRALPAPARQMVGPFIFFDQMGPAEFLTGGGIDVRPHPHIGLATVSYLFDGQIMLAKPHFLALDLASAAGSVGRRYRREGLPVVGWTVRSKDELATYAPDLDNYIFEGFAA